MKKFDYSWLLAILFFGVLSLFVTSCSNPNSSQELHSITFYFQGEDEVIITLKKGEVVDTIVFGESVQLSIENNTPCIAFLTPDVDSPCPYQYVWTDPVGFSSGHQSLQIINTELYNNSLYEGEGMFDLSCGESIQLDGYFPGQNSDNLEYEYSWTINNSQWRQESLEELPTNTY